MMTIIKMDNLLYFDHQTQGSGFVEQPDPEHPGWGISQVEARPLEWWCDKTFISNIYISYCMYIYFSLPELVRLQLRECQIETVSGTHILVMTMVTILMIMVMVMVMLMVVVFTRVRILIMVPLAKAFLGLGRLEWLALDKNFLTTLGINRSSSIIIKYT